MRVVELSDHPGTLLREARTRRDQARASHRWWAWIRAAFAAWTGRGKVKVRPPALGVPSAQEESIAAGRAGEQLVATELGAALGDEWILFRGYRNARGEIDHLLAGPRGLFAVEVKYHNATMYISGDDWRFDRFDRWGNRVGQGRVEDRTGRSPSVQLNEPADELEKFLRSRGQQVRIKRIVILNHPRSRIGGQRNATVQVTTSSRQIIDLVGRSRLELTPGRLTQIASLVERDHHFHDGRRRPK
jgi:Nuclease-related domain